MSAEPSEPPGPAALPERSSEVGLDPAIAALELRLGVAIPDPALALSALTHKSYVNEHRGEVLSDNERLEFLGDAVIDLAVSHRLMERFPEAREGDLSKIRAAVVDEAGLARIARELDLGPLLRLGRGEELTGGRQKSSLLADTMEAVIAAVYLTGGLAAVLRIVDRFLGEAFARAAAGTLDRDYKTQFQELAQSRLRATPRYRVVAEHGPDHSKIFDVELELRGDVVGRGAGRSKKDAEQAAAKLALEVMNGRGEAAAPGPPEARATAPDDPATPSPSEPCADGAPAGASEERVVPGEREVHEPEPPPAIAAEAPEVAAEPEPAAPVVRKPRKVAPPKPRKRAAAARKPAGTRRAGRAKK
jgi:ribonuclease III